jgi:signal transduction histidine kinase
MLDLSTIAVTTLMSISSYLGVMSMPAQIESQWNVTQGWQADGKFYNFEANSSRIPELCRENPNAFVAFPVIIHSAHYLYLDNRLIEQFGDKSFQNIRSFFGSTVLQCSVVKDGINLRWSAYSYSKYFARFSAFPSVTVSRPATNFFGETINEIATGFLIVLAMIQFIFFYGKIPSGIALSFTLANLFFAGFFLWGVASSFGIEVSMLHAHILADGSIFLGVSLFFNSLRLRKLISTKSLLLFVAAKLVSYVIFAFAKDGDTVQFATTLTFPLAMNLILATMVPLYRKIRSKQISRGELLQFLSLGFFMASIVNDILMVLGIVDTYPMLAFGVMSALLFGSLSLHEQIIATYEERDYLRKNLEVAVDNKTRDLNAALNDLKHAQAELVQSAKLASLGTLSAGIAHEINNSLNYVNGALVPLEGVLAKVELGEKKKKTFELIHVMKHGLNLTFDIMTSLRNYSGLNQASFKDLYLHEVIHSILVILRAKLAKTQVKLDIDRSIYVHAHLVGLNQTLMNLVVNAIDAMPDGGVLTISTKRVGAKISLAVSDNGAGIDPAIQSRLFDPFFTTKEAGKGTGLGLYIVKQEADRHNAQISVDSTPGKGTTFTLLFPDMTTPSVERRAA